MCSFRCVNSDFPTKFGLFGYVEINLPVSCRNSVSVIAQVIKVCVARTRNPLRNMFGAIPRAKRSEPFSLQPLRKHNPSRTTGAMFPCCVAAVLMRHFRRKSPHPDTSAAGYDVIGVARQIRRQASPSLHVTSGRRRNLCDVFHGCVFWFVLNQGLWKRF